MPNLTLGSLYTRIWQREYTDSTYTSVFFLEDAHIITQDIWSDIIYARKWDRNWDIWTADTVALQDEYTTPTKSSTIVWADWIESVSVAYGSDIYTASWNKQYIPCSQATIEQKKNWVYFSENQPKESPIFYESDWSVFIAPDPRTSEAWVWRLKITWVRNNASGGWTTSTTEQETKLPLFLLDVLYYGIVWKANEFMRRDPNIVQSKYNFYVDQKKRWIMKLNTESSESYDSSDLVDSWQVNDFNAIV